MTNVTKLKAQIEVSGTVKLGKSTFSITEALDHGAKIYDKLYLLQEQQLDYYRELGNILLQVRSLHKDNISFGKAIASSALAGISKQDRSDTIFIAANWIKIQKLNKNGLFDTLGVSAIRKRVKASDQPKTKVGSAGNVSKGKKASTAKAEPKQDNSKAIPKPKTELDLAKLVHQIMTEAGFSKATFTKELTKLYKKS
jgi:hypothetical protein|tara:strand:- start:78 stop:671 length:594 start_codon:yes stop_codon:yes gene_type:complete